MAETPFSVDSFDQFACRRPVVIEMNTEHQIILMGLAAVAAIIALLFHRRTERRGTWGSRK